MTNAIRSINWSTVLIIVHSSVRDLSDNFVSYFFFFFFTAKMFLNILCVALIGTQVLSTTRASPLETVNPKVGDDIVAAIPKILEGANERQIFVYPNEQLIPGSDFVKQNTDDLIAAATTLANTSIQTLPTKNPQSLKGIVGIIADASHQIVNENAKIINKATDDFLTGAQAFLSSSHAIVDANKELVMTFPRFGFAFYKRLDELSEKTASR